MWRKIGAQTVALAASFVPFLCVSYVFVFGLELLGATDWQAILITITCGNTAVLFGPAIMRRYSTWRLMRKHRYHIYHPEATEARYMARIHKLQLDAVTCEVRDFHAVATTDTIGHYQVRVLLRELGLGVRREFEFSQTASVADLCILVDICRRLQPGSETETFPVDVLLQDDSVKGLASRAMNCALLQ